MNELNKNQEKTPPTDNLISILQIRTDALIKYSQRIWTLFNWFLTLQVAILGYYFRTMQLDSHTLAVPIVGLTLSVLWLLIGINDFKSFNKHKSVKTEIEKKVSKNLNISNLLGYNQSEKEQNKKFEFRQTYMLMIFPIIVFLLWLYIVVGN